MSNTPKITILGSAQKLSELNKSLLKKLSFNLKNKEAISVVYSCRQLVPQERGLKT